MSPLPDLLSAQRPRLPDARAVAVLICTAAMMTTSMPADATLLAEQHALRRAATAAEASGGVRLPGLLRNYLRLRKQTPAEPLDDEQAEDGGAPDSLAVVLPSVIQTVAQVRAGAPTGLFGALDAADRAYLQALQRLHAGSSDNTPQFMVAVLESVADGQAAMDQALDLAASLDPQAVGLLLPAVQAAREAARRKGSMLIDLALSAGVSEGRIAPAQEALRQADALFAAGDYGGAGQQHAAGFGLAATTMVFSMDRFEQNLRSVFDANTVGWAYALSQGGQLARSGAGGLARTGADMPPVPQSPTKKMHVASVSKTMTAIVALRRLEEMGLSDETEIGPWLPADWARGAEVDSISFRQLMTHTSGFGQNGICGGSYDRLREMVSQDVPFKGSFDYCNANFGLIRVLLPRMLGVDLAALPTDPSVLSSAVFLSYAQLVFDPAGVPFSCDPQAVNPTLQYQFPDTGNPGFVEPPNSLNCGGVGVQISATDLARTMSFLRYTQDVMPTSRFNTMKRQFLGFMNPARYGSAAGTFGTYHTHGGDWDHSGGAGAGGLDACIMMFPINVEAALTINSSPKGTGLGGYPNDGGNSQCGVLKWAFETAWVAQ